MRRALVMIAVAATAGGLAWVAAPALSLSPYVPEPVEFEQELPPLRALDRDAPAVRAAGHVRAARVRFVSPVIESPRRFDAVGVGREVRPYELRVRDPDGDWSPWTETEDGTPIWAGGAEAVQLRSRGTRLSGSLHYVNVSGTATAADRALTALRGAINSAFIGVASATPAEAEVPKPDIQRRSSWDPHDDCHPRSAPLYGEVKSATVHHTVTANDYSASETPQIIRAICLFHRNGNGWNDIGYNAVVDRFGRVWEGRAGGIGKAVIGAHNQGFNSQTTGVALLGDHSSAPITHEAMRALVHYLAWKLAHHGVDAVGRAKLISAGGESSRYPSGAKVWVKRIIGHRRTNYTECPGDALYHQLGTVRRRAQRRIDAFSANEPPPSAAARVRRQGAAR